MLGPEWPEVNGDVKIDRVMSFARSIAGSEMMGNVLQSWRMAISLNLTLTYNACKVYTVTQLLAFVKLTIDYSI